MQYRSGPGIADFGFWNETNLEYRMMGFWIEAIGEQMNEPNMSE